MSAPPPSHPVPSGYPPGQPPLPPRYRPSGWWFVLGGFLVVAALVAAVGLFVWTLSAFFSTDADLQADGRPHQVSVSTDGERMLWRASSLPDPDCTVVDRVTGSQVALRPVVAQLTRDAGDGTFVAAYRFDPGSGDLEVTCTPSGAFPVRSTSVEIGPAPSIGGFVGGVVLTITVPALLGVLGLVTLIATGVLWSTRPARPRSGHDPAA